MKLKSRFLFAAIFAAISVLLSGRARAVVVNFDDLPDDQDTTLTGGSYAGLIWETGNAGLNGNLGLWVTPMSTRHGVYPHSPPHNVTNASGATEIGITFGAPVDVLGAYIAAQGDPGGAIATGLTVRGYLAGQLVGTTAQFTDINTSPDWFAMNLQDVDRIVFESVPAFANAGFFGMDDLTYTPLPEPSTIFLLSLSVLSLLPRRRARR